MSEEVAIAFSPASPLRPMPIHAVSRYCARVARKLPLQTVLIVSFVLQIVGTVGLVGYLSYRNGQEAVNNVASRYRSEVSDRVTQYLHSYLEKPHLLNQINANAIRLGQLNLQDKQRLEHYLWQQLQLFNSLTSSTIAAEQEGVIRAARREDGTVEVESQVRAGSTSYIYLTDNQGNRTQLSKKIAKYDSRNSEWYQVGVAQGKAAWTPVSYCTTYPSEISINAVLPFYDGEKKLIGVLKSSLNLNEINNFLNTLKIGGIGRVFIIDRSGLIVASSTSEKPIINQDQGKPLLRLKATQSTIPLIRSSAQYLTTHFSNFNQIKSTQKLNFSLKGEQQFLQVTPVRDQYGLDLILVVAVPESDFMEQIKVNTRTTILLCIAALVVSSGIILIIVLWITKPIRRLNIAVKDIAQGQWDNRVGNSCFDLTNRKQAEKLLADYNQTLEVQVNERTAELTRGNAQLKVEVANRKLLESKLYNYTQQVQAILDNSPTVIYIINRHNKHLLVNRSYQTLLSIPQDKIITKSIYEVWPVEIADTFAANNQLVLESNEPITTEEVAPQADGLHTYMTIKFPLHDEHGVPYAVCSISTDITDRKRIEEALRASEKRFQEIAVTISQFFFVRSASSGQFLYVSPAYEKIWGRTCESLYQNPQSWLEALHPEDRQLVQESLIQQFQGTPIKREYRIIRPDGEERWIVAYISVVRDEMGEPLRFIGVAEDITERKLAQLALQASQARFAGIVEIANDAIITVDANQCITLFNQGAEKMFGYAAEEVLSQPLAVLLPVRARAIHHQHVTTFVESVGTARRMGERNEIFGRRKDGTEFSAEASISKLQINGEKICTAIVRDISDRKLTQQELQKSEERLQLALEGSGDGLWDWQIKIGELYLSPRYIEMLGYDVDEFPLEFSTWERLIHPDDKPWVIDRLNAHLADSSVSYKFHYRLLTKSGEWKWIANYGKVVARDQHGAPLRMTGTHRDINEQKIAELELQHSKHFIEQIANASPSILYIYDLIENRNIYCNREIATVLGYTPQQIQELGEAFMPTILHPDDLAKAPENLQKFSNLAEGEVFELEYQMRDTNGKWHTLFSRTTAFVRNSDGKVTQVIGTATDITERKLAELALKQSQARYLAMIEDQTELITRFQPDGTLTFVNEAFCHFYGKSRSEIINKPYKPFIFPEDMEKITQLLNSLNVENPVGTIEHRVLVAEEVRWMQWINRAIFDDNGEFVEFQSAGRDITERKQTEEKLKLSEAQLNTIITNTSDGIMILDHKNQVRFANPATVALFNLSLDELIGYEWGIPLGETPEVELISSSGEVRVVEMRATQTQWLGELAYIVALRDISDRKQVQKELQQAAYAAEAANHAKSQFLANMSHELRTPLNGILGYAQILQKDKNRTPQQKQGIEIIHQCGEHLLTLINDILDISKIEAGKLELYPETINFPSFLKGISELFQIKAQQKEINFTFQSINQLPPNVHTDEKRLRQILLNLLSNAVKFTHTGSVKFHVSVIINRSLVIDNRDKRDNEEHRELNVGTSSASSQLPITNYPLPILKIRFQIEDTGIGINPEQLEKIFLPFEQVGDSANRAEGTGLGLAITKKILAIMGSEIFVESTPGVGSRFWFELDLPTTSDLMELTPIKSSNNIIGYQGEKRKILVVDDRWDNRAVIINMLEPIGFEVIEASDGREGLEKAVELKPDLILLDLIMPVMDGFQITESLRQLPEFQETIVIAISANLSEAERLYTQASGCQDFLPKPVKAEELQEKLERYLGLSWVWVNQNHTQTQEALDPSRLCFPTSPSESDPLQPPGEQKAKQHLTPPFLRGAGGGSSRGENSIKVPQFMGGWGGDPDLNTRPNHNAQAAPTEMVIPPIEELIPLYEAALIAHVTGVKQIATQLQQLSPDYTAFATKILELAANFDCEEIANLVDQYLAKDSE